MCIRDKIIWIGGREERDGWTDDEMQSPEIQQMYSLNMPVSAIRTKIRQEFERHRYVSQIKTVDVLLFNSNQEYQVSSGWSALLEKGEELRAVALDGRRWLFGFGDGREGIMLMEFRPQETLNYWKQLTHVLKYFRAEEDPKARLHKTFIQGFIEVRKEKGYASLLGFH